MNNYTQLYK